MKLELAEVVLTIDFLAFRRRIRGFRIHFASGHEASEQLVDCLIFFCTLIDILWFFLETARGVTR